VEDGPRRGCPAGAKDPGSAVGAIRSGTTDRVTTSAPVKDEQFTSGRCPVRLGQFGGREAIIHPTSANDSGRRMSCGSPLPRHGRPGIRLVLFPSARGGPSAERSLSLSQSRGDPRRHTEEESNARRIQPPSGERPAPCSPPR